MFMTLRAKLLKERTQRSIDLYESGLSRQATYRITGVDPVEARHVGMVRVAFYGLFVASIAASVLASVWRGVVL